MPRLPTHLRSFFAAEEPLRKMAATKIAKKVPRSPRNPSPPRARRRFRPKLHPSASPARRGSGLRGNSAAIRSFGALGKGAMGAVYLAEDTQLERKVAIKTPHFEDDPTGELIARFYREARAAATLRHANICPVYDVGQIDGKHFISMAYIEGRPLSDLIRSGKAAERTADSDRHAQAGPRAPAGTRPRDRAPRSQAGQHHGRQAGRADHHGLRPGPQTRAERERPASRTAA